LTATITTLQRAAIYAFASCTIALSIILDSAAFSTVAMQRSGCYCDTLEAPPSQRARLLADVAAHDLAHVLRRDYSLMRSTGFSLVEVLVATSIIVVGAASLVQLYGISAYTNRMASDTSTTLILAVQQMERLLGETDLGLSPAGALGADTKGFVDYLDQTGRSLAISSIMPAGARFVCRWSIEPLPGDPAGGLVIQVLVLGWPKGAVRARLVTVKFRIVH
jgi:prepilin-type N-terminal cleavage/methylation domain-containing protein